MADEQPPVLPEGWKLTIYRAVPITQETDLPDNYPFNNVEDIGDKLTMICQQLADGVNRSLKTSISDNSDLDITVPWQAGKSFRISDDGTKLELTDDPARVTPQVQSLLSQTQVQAQIATTNATSAANSALDANIYAANAKSYMETAKDYSENVNVFIPSVSSDGVISWTNKAGLENPASVSVKGDKGDKGEQGIQGVQGLTGATGPQGEKGDKGDKGDTGATGATGATGSKGDKGDKGDAGTAATITIGTVTKGDTASVTNVGTTTAAKLNFVLPKGDKGDTGAQGEQGEKGAKGDTGPQGATGAAGAAATVTIGTVTTGEAGTDASVTNSGTTSAAVLNFIIPRGANGADGGIEVDDALSGTSTNPVQNKVINEALNSKADSSMLSAYLPLAGGTCTGGVSAPNFQTGTGTTNYFQCQKIRGEGDANTYYHAVDFGYKGHDSVDFYEYNPNWNFYKCPYGAKITAVLVGKINENGWNGGAVLSGTPTAPTAAAGTNTTQIATTAFVQTAVSSKVDTSSLATVATSGSYSDLSDTPTIPTVPTTVSSFTNDAGYLTEHQSLADYTKTEDLAAVATSGSYNDLADKPTIPDTSSFAQTSAANTWSSLQTFATVDYTMDYASAVTSATPNTSVGYYIASGAFTLDLSTLVSSLGTTQSMVFSCTIANTTDSDITLTVTGASSYRYIGSASDLAVSANGMVLLNVLLSKPVDDCIAILQGMSTSDS